MLSDNEIMDAFCVTPNIHQFVTAFKAGARYAEAAVLAKLQAQSEPCGYDETTGNCTSNPCCRAAPVQAQSTYGWLFACDEELVSAHLGVAEVSHSYETAKKKLSELIQWHVAVATDPAVNGGFSLQPVQQDVNQQLLEVLKEFVGAVEGKVEMLAAPMQQDGALIDEGSKTNKLLDALKSAAEAMDNCFYAIADVALTDDLNNYGATIKQVRAAIAAAEGEV